MKEGVNWKNMKIFGGVVVVVSCCRRPTLSFEPFFNFHLEKIFDIDNFNNRQ